MFEVWSFTLFKNLMLTVKGRNMTPLNLKMRCFRVVYTWPILSFFNIINLINFFHSTITQLFKKHINQSLKLAIW